MGAARARSSCGLVKAGSYAGVGRGRGWAGCPGGRALHFMALLMTSWCAVPVSQNAELSFHYQCISRGGEQWCKVFSVSTLEVAGPGTYVGELVNPSEVPLVCLQPFRNLSENLGSV